MSDQEECPGVDTVFPLPVRRPDGSVPVIHHTRDHGYQMCELRKLEDGKPINGGMLVQVGEAGKEGWCNMKPLLNTKSTKPAMVNSMEYKHGWTNIFGHQDYGQA